MYLIIGEGIDGYIIKPALPCPGIDINYNDYVTKIGKNNNIIRTKDIFDNLPDDLDGEAYYKESYLCNVKQSQIPAGLFTQSKMQKMFSKSDEIPQLIIKYIDGIEFFNFLANTIYKNYSLTNCEWMELLETVIKFYDTIAAMNNKNVYHNDIDINNIMYVKNENKLLLIDFDKATFDSPKKVGPKIHYSDSEEFDFDENYAYANDKKSYINHVVFEVINIMCSRKPISDDVPEDAGELINIEEFRARKSVFDEHGIDYKSKNIEDMFGRLQSVFPEIKRELCEPPPPPKPSRSRRKTRAKTRGKKRVKSRRREKKQKTRTRATKI